MTPQWTDSAKYIQVLENIINIWSVPVPHVKVWKHLHLREEVDRVPKA